jgi:DeoR/GlpR family transcriptional regulator of sugar metabolism
VDPNGSGEAPVFATERRERIAELVTVRGRVHIADLSDRLGVSEQTIRKDLTVLQGQAVLERTHGGAIALRAPVDRERSGRPATDRASKDAIGRRCAALLRDGNSIYIDAGTTTAAIARAIAAPAGAPRLRDITVLTNAPAVAALLADLPEVEHVLLGGQLLRSRGSVVGPVALHTLRRFTVDVAFIGAGGLSEGGVTSSDVAEAEVEASVVERARRVVVPIHHTKVGATGFARVCALDDVDVVVLDQATEQIEALCAAHHIGLLVAE